jgi:peptide deformylase
MIRRILEYPDPVLRRIADPITEVTPALEALVGDMFRTMHKNLGVGLAAPQVGESVRLAVIELPLNENDPQAGVRYVFVNPKLGVLGQRRDITEGCLSLPGFRAEVNRAESAAVTFTNLQGELEHLEATGLLAQAIQHELDHLDGVLFFDHLESLDDLEQIPPDGLDWVLSEADELV